jgi:hypothetical protein
MTSILKKKAIAKKQTSVLTARIPTDLYAKFKAHCEECGFSLNEALKLLVENEVKNEEDVVYKNEEEITSKPAHITPSKPATAHITPNTSHIYPGYVNPLTSNEDCYILRKTAKVGKPETQGRTYNLGPATWVIPEGCRSHFDADGERIPYRFTDENGKVCEPDDDELHFLSIDLGKDIEVEK